ncbi:hypothetical protein llap_18250 [Limosa lapponica baueri]|uniref:Calponin-homology (CH) domain-containing protein n=1 Tax=Limosa lapponica baueri TaxID=1758121 RepID=A0A2I0TCB9_LIMLA|nr:hypothetical protein llap_18250 [Limosa lapponica baueri]
MPEAAPQEESPAPEVAEDEEAPKSMADPRQEGGEKPSGKRQGVGGDPNPASLHPGLIVQVKERFQGEVQKARLVLEPRRSAAAGASLEEGTTVIARLLENPAEKDCEKAVSQLVQLQRSGAGNRRAVLLPLPGGTDGRTEGLLSPSSTTSGQEPAKSWEPVASTTLDAWGRGGSNDPSSSVAWTCSSMAEPGTVSELSTPSPMISDIYISGESGDMSAKEKLLLWTQKVTAGYIGVKCTNFSSCWSDGKMFNALIHRYRPDLVDMERVQIQSNRENLEQAFEIAERLGVTRLLDAEDVDVPSPDEKSVITYVSSIYDAFPKVPEGGEGISAIEVDSRWLEYQSRVESLISWIKQHTILMSDKSFPQNPVELKVWIEFGRIKLPQGYHPNDVEEEWGKLIIEMLEREKLLRPAVERIMELPRLEGTFQIIESNHQLNTGKTITKPYL